MPPVKNLSFADLMGGVGKGHRAIAALPGAQRIPLGMRQAQSGMLPSQVLEQYNQAGMFGKTASGEPIRATMSSANQGAVQSGYMPATGKIRLDPESKVPKDIDEAHARGIHPNITWSPSRLDKNKTPLGFELERYMLEAAQRDPRYQAAMRQPLSSSMPNPSMTELYAMDVKPGTYGLKDPDAAWWKSLPAKGKELYALAYDMMRAQGHGNFASHLTDVNQVRRLGNVASHSLGHGNLGYIAPVEEVAYSPGMSGQLFSMPVQASHKEDYYLKKLFGGPGLKTNAKTDELMDAAQDLRTPNFLTMTPDETIGTLMTREAQMAGAYGPGTGTASPLRVSQVRPYEDVLLKNLAEPQVMANPQDLAGAFGPTTLGRQATTEALIRGMLKGYDPEEIVERLVKEAPAGSYKNRYKKGGLAHAAVIA